MPSISGETIVEVGLGAFALALVGAAVAIGLGRVIGAGQRRRNNAEPAPPANTVPDERHSHVVTMAAR